MQLRNGIVWWIWLDLCDKHTKHKKSVDFFYDIMIRLCLTRMTVHSTLSYGFWQFAFFATNRIVKSLRMHTWVCALLTEQVDCDSNVILIWTATETEFTMFNERPLQKYAYIHSLGEHFWYVGQGVSSFSLIFILWRIWSMRILCYFHENFDTQSILKTKLSESQEMNIKSKAKLKNLIIF